MPNDNQDDVLNQNINVEEMQKQINDEEFEKQFQTLDAQRQRYKTKFEKEKEDRIKFEDELKQTKEKLAAFETKKADDSSKTQVDDLPIREVLSLRSEGYSEKEILELVDEAKSLGIPVRKILTNPTFKSGLEVKRSKEKAEQNTPSPSFGSLSFKGKDYSELKTDAERREAFNELSRRGFKQTL